MDEQEWLAKQFEANRRHLRKVAYRILGSVNEADDAVQEAWLRVGRADTGDVGNLGGWLTTIVSRVCLDMLRARKRRREESLDAHQPEPSLIDLGEDALVADSAGLALLVILETLRPSERIAYVLHDIFDLPFDEIGPIIARSPAAARQLASRARRRVRGGSMVPAADRACQLRCVEAFLAACRDGDFDALIAVLDPEVVRRADAVAAPNEANRVIRGASAVAKSALRFSDRAASARLVLIEDAVSLACFQDGQATIALNFTVELEKIVDIEIIADPAKLRGLDIAELKDGRSLHYRVGRHKMRV